MATKAMSREMVAPTCAAYLAAGGSTEAAALERGLSFSTAQRHLRWARDYAPDLLQAHRPRHSPPPPAPKIAAFTAPVLPPEDEDLEDTISRLEQEQTRRETYRSAVEWMRFDVHGRQPFALAFVGDPHIDVCDIRTLRRHIDTIQATPRMWAVGLGDWINGWVGKLRGEYAHQTVTERQAYTLARWLLQKPDLWWLILLGNHDGQRWHGQGSPLRWMENAAAVPAQEWACKFSVACGDRLWRISAAHNFPGSSQYNPNHGPKKRALFTGAEADIFVAGDRHTFALEQNQHEHTGKVF